MRRLVVLLLALAVLAGCAGEETAAPGGSTPGGSTPGGSTPGAATAGTGDDPTSGDGPDRPAPDESSTADASPAGAAPAPFDGEVVTVDGSVVAGEDYAAQDLALWFWTPW